MVEFTSVVPVIILLITMAKSRLAFVDLWLAFVDTWLAFVDL